MIATKTRFSTFTFSARELQQIVALVHSWAAGAILPLDCRTCTKQVRTYAERWGLIERHEDGRLYFGGGSRFEPIHDLPVEALWLLVRPMLNGQRTRGFSLTNDPRWATLNIYPATDRHYGTRDHDAQVETLLRLQRYGYLIVQMGGSVWEITDQTWKAASEDTRKA